MSDKIDEAVCPDCNIPMDYVSVSHPNKKNAKIMFNGYHCESCDKLFSPTFLNGFWKGYNKGVQDSKESD